MVLKNRRCSQKYSQGWICWYCCTLLSPVRSKMIQTTGPFRPTWFPTKLTYVLGTMTAVWADLHHTVSPVLPKGRPRAFSPSSVSTPLQQLVGLNVYRIWLLISFVYQRVRACIYYQSCCLFGYEMVLCCALRKYTKRLLLLTASKTCIRNRNNPKNTFRHRVKRFWKSYFLCFRRRSSKSSTRNPSCHCIVVSNCFCYILRHKFNHNNDEPLLPFGFASSVRLRVCSSWVECIEIYR